MIETGDRTMMPLGQVCILQVSYTIDRATLAQANAPAAVLERIEKLNLVQRIAEMLVEAGSDVLIERERSDEEKRQDAAHGVQTRVLGLSVNSAHVTRRVFDAIDAARREGLRQGLKHAADEIAAVERHAPSAVLRAIEHGLRGFADKVPL